MTVDLPAVEELPALRASARAWSEALRLPFRHKRWRGQAGEWAGMGVGSSLDFQDHRAYQPGDDPRQINWQAYARTGHYTMKLYREEVRPLADLVLDASDSMWAFEEKRSRAVELFYYAWEGALRAGAAARVFAVKGEAVAPLAEEAVASGRWLEAVRALPPTAAHVMPAVGRVPFRGGSLRLLVSDLLFPGAPEGVIQPLAGQHGRGLVFAPTSSEEARPGWEGNYEFVEAESGETNLRRINPELLARYTEAYRRHFELWKGCALRHGVALARVPSEMDLGQALRAEAVAAGAVEV